MAEDSDLEKTESASPRRLEKAREEGQVPHSKELTTFAILLAAGAGLGAMGTGIMGRMSHLMSSGLTLDRASVFDPMRAMARLYSFSFEALMTFMPVFSLIFIVTIASSMVLSGWVFTLEALQPKFSKLSLSEGISRMFSVNSLMELGKAILKSVLIGGVAAWVLWHNKEAFLSMASESLEGAIAHLGHLLFVCFMMVVGSMALIVAVDVPFQLWSYADKLKMTKEEVRKEAKENEGDPHVKGKIRSMQREMARRRMMAEIPKADVIVTNPTHYAVALRYQENSMGAPIVVAKGRDIVAAKIREIGAEHSIPMLEAPPLARALYFHTEIGDAIPEALYAAVAEVLAYVYQLAQGVFAAPPRDLPVPKNLDPEAA